MSLLRADPITASAAPPVDLVAPFLRLLPALYAHLQGEGDYLVFLSAEGLPSATMSTPHSIEAASGGCVF